MFRKKTAGRKTGTSRKLFTLMLLLVMVFSLATGAFAAQKKNGNKVQNNRHDQKKVTASAKLKGKKKRSSGKSQKDRPVSISKRSWLHGMFGDQETVVHFHHQCVNKVGKDLVATMWGCDNGEIEAVEHKTLPVYGVQWHPDQMGGTGNQNGQKFMSICRKYR